MYSELTIILSVVAAVAISALIYFYFGHYLRISHENRYLNEKIKEIDEIVDRRVRERTKQLENMRDSISKYAVQRFELAQELEIKNLRILEQKDLTEKQSEKLRVAYEEIRKLEIFRQQMVQMMIHDLKNPLNVILNLTDTEAIPARPAALIRQISYEMLDLILNLLEVQKFKEMKMTVENENIHLNSLIKNLTGKLNLLFINASIELKTSIPQTCWINADRHILNRILTNILSNAIKYTPPGGLIQISVNQKDGEIMLEIRDNGNGISEERIKDMFEMYRQGAKTEAMYNSSTGIGLAYCRLAVEALGGRIGIVSDYGKGTTVWFTLNPGISEYTAPEEITDNIEIKIHEIGLTDDDIEFLKPIIAELQPISIYEVTEILNITKKIACSDNVRILSWIESLEESLFSANEQRYRKLLNII
jgi:signal transduction histidine kinase